MYGSALPPFVDVPPVPLKPAVAERSANVTVSTPLGSLETAWSVKPPLPPVVR